MDLWETGTTLALIGLLLVGMLLLRLVVLRFADLDDLPTRYRRRVERCTACSRSLAALAGGLCLAGLMLAELS